MPSLDIEFVKHQYEFELDRRKELSSAVSFPVGILTGLGGILVYMTQGFSFQFKYVTASFVLSVGLSVGFFAAAVIYLIRSYWNHAFQYLPSPGVLTHYRNGLRQYYQHLQGNDGPTETEFTDYLIERLVQATDANVFENDSKSADLHRGNTMLIGALIAGLIASVPYVVDSVYKPEKVPKVQISNIREISMGSGKTEDAGKPPLQKPEPPPNRVLREGETPKKQGG